MDSGLKIGIPRYKSKKSPFTILPSPATFYTYHPYFSFRYYHRQSDKFSVENLKSMKEIKVLFNKLHELSQYTWKEIFDKADLYHVHKVDWSATEYKKGFSHLPDEIKESPVYQFKVFKECRILGLFNKDNVFKIVWIDRNHIVYKRK
jgi:hypothetical protein